MPKKTKQGKGRLDKFYYLAREQGLRSRAAWKLIQLNRKYDFLSQAKCVVDLCAAPGGWLQVCAKYMPVASIKIGVDLDPIPAIKGCLTFQADITTERCMALIRKELKHFKADCVLNDGAPNVGANWSVDAYNQVELSLHALKIATQTLRKGGWFITKVFRSTDYNALMYVANQLFVKVESSKPAASRSTSAEIFMVCQGYKAPDSIDPRLLDPKYALEEVADDPNQGTSTEKISSLKKLLTQKVNRSGYEDGRSILFAECDFMDFLQAADPHEYLSSYNKFKLSKEAREAIDGLRLPKDLDVICDDLKTCGRREFADLLKVRHKYALRLQQNEAKAAGTEPVQELTPEQLEAQVDRELEQALKRAEQVKKRQGKKARKQEQKQDMMKKMSVIGHLNMNEDELDLDPKTRARMRAMMADEDAPQYCAPDEPDEADMDPVERRHKFLTDGAQEADDEAAESSDDESEDAKVAQVDRMADEIDEALKQEKAYKMLRDKKEAKKERKAKALVDQHRQRKEEVKIDALLANDDLRNDYSRANEEAGQREESENDDDLEEERMALAEALRKKKEDAKKAEEDEDDEEERQMFLNPLLALKDTGKKKNNEEEESEWSDDDKYDAKETKAERKERRAKERKLLGKKRAATGLQGDIDDVQDFFKNEFEEVPANDLEKKNEAEKKDLPDGYSSMDSDEMAETRALAKKMLRKKFRTEMIDASYSRYAHDDDESILPSWFLEDEAKHNIPNINLTKEEVADEKRQLMEWNARPSKKVMEAKQRKQARLRRAMDKVKAKAQVVASQDISEGAKMRQIQKMYSKEQAKHKEEKTYVVNRRVTSTMGAKAGRNVKMVDARMRADTRNLKHKKKKKGGQGLGRVSKGSKRIKKK